METAPGDFESPIKSPILELVFDKSKVDTGFDGRILLLPSGLGPGVGSRGGGQSGYQKIAYNQRNFRDRDQYHGTRAGGVGPADGRGSHADNIGNADSETVVAGGDS